MKRWLWVDAESGDYAREALKFPGLRMLIRVEREVRHGDGKLEGETRYFATSLDPEKVTAAGLLALVRGHWCVENNLHFVKDRWWDEDRHYTSRPGLAEALAVLLNAALAVLVVTADPDDETPLRARADELGWHLADTLEWFTGQTL